jgi:hypothetical protein
VELFAKLVNASIPESISPLVTEIMLIAGDMTNIVNPELSSTIARTKIVVSNFLPLINQTIREIKLTLIRKIGIAMYHVVM